MIVRIPVPQKPFVPVSQSMYNWIYLTQPKPNYTIGKIVLNECFPVIKTSNYTIYYPHRFKRKNARDTRNDYTGMLSSFILLHRLLHLEILNHKLTSSDTLEDILDII